MNVLEFIKSLLPTSIPTYLNEIPLGEFGLLIEETGINGKTYSFKGFDGVVQSTIQLYIRANRAMGSYTENMTRLKEYYKVIQANTGKEIDNIRLLWVGSFTLTSLKDDKNNPCFSMLFPIIYKE